MKQTHPVNSGAHGKEGERGGGDETQTDEETGLLR